MVAVIFSPFYLLIVHVRPPREEEKVRLALKIIPGRSWKKCDKSSIPTNMKSSPRYTVKSKKQFCQMRGSMILFLWKSTHKHKAIKQYYMSFCYTPIYLSTPLFLNQCKEKGLRVRSQTENRHHFLLLVERLLGLERVVVRETQSTLHRDSEYSEYINMLLT